jgi:hypothetical protein
MNDEKKDQSPMQNDRKHRESSLAEFSRETGIRIELLRRYINRQTRQMTNDTWNKILPAFKLLSEQDTQGGRRIGPPYRRHAELVEMLSDQKVLLDIFDILNEEQRKEVINTLESACPEKSVPTTYKSLSVDENKLMGAFLALPPEEQQSQLLALVRLGTEKLRKRRQEMF